MWLGGSFRHVSKASRPELCCPKDEGPESHEQTSGGRKGQMTSENPDTGLAEAEKATGMRKAGALLQIPYE